MQDTYKLTMLIGGKTKSFEFGKCHEGLDAALSYSSNATAFVITFGDELVDERNGSLLCDLSTLTPWMI